MLINFWLLVDEWLDAENPKGENMAAAQACLGLHRVVPGGADDAWCVSAERRGRQRVLAPRNGQGMAGGLENSHLLTIRKWEP